MNQSQRDLYQNQAKQEQKKVPLTLYGGKFYQRGETRSQESEVGRRGGRGKERGRGWSIIKKTFFTPIGSQEPTKAKKKTWKKQHPTEEHMDNHRPYVNTSLPTEVTQDHQNPFCDYDELEDEGSRHLDSLPHLPSYSDYQPDYPDDLTSRQHPRLSRYDYQAHHQSQARHYTHSPSNQYREYHNLSRHDHQNIPQDY